jgi:hypothetical protein
MVSRIRTAGDVSLLTRAESLGRHSTNAIRVSHLYLSRDKMTSISAETLYREIGDVQLQDVLKTDDKVLREGTAATADEMRTINVGGQLLVDAVATPIPDSCRRNAIELIAEGIRKAINVTEDLWFLFVFDRETAALIRQANADSLCCADCTGPSFSSCHD